MFTASQENPVANRPSPFLGPRSTLNFDDKPMVVIWEVTQACDLSCYHCRASAQPLRHNMELTTAQGRRLIDEIAAMRTPIFVLTGGDPLKRPDIYELVEHATLKGVRAALTPSATPLLTQAAIAELKKRGLARLAISLDGPSAEIHDSFRGVPGSYQHTMDAVRWARECHLPVQVNTTVTRRNHRDLETFVPLLQEMGVVLWSVFFLVPTGRGKQDDLLSAEECEQVFEKRYQISRRVKFHIKTTEGQHYRRFLLQKHAAEQIAPRAENSARPKAPAGVAYALDGTRPGVNDGKGFVFISHTGEVFPSGFLPLSGGNVREQPLAEIYRTSPLFMALRDTKQLHGKCGVCEYNQICGGSRARAYAVTGDAFAPDPCCIYQPEAATAAS
jgi:AdoMet-dependent heme synthase